MNDEAEQIRTFDNRDTVYTDELRRARREEQRLELSQPEPLAPEIEAMQQMLSEAFHREMLLRAELVRTRRANKPDNVRNP